MTTHQDSYNQDFHAWILRNVDLLRRGRLSEIDSEHIAEELESMGKRDKRQIVNRLIVLLLHLLKWTYQQDARSSGWKGSIIEQRRRIAQLLEDSPSLIHDVSAKSDYAYAEAVKQAAIESGLAETAFPARCPYTQIQILDDSFYPEA